MPPLAHPSVAIIGGGWAGLACALRLAKAGYQPVVFEAAPEPGGRARQAPIAGELRDNGQHLMLAGCRALNSLFAEAGIELPTIPFAFSSGARTLVLGSQTGRLGLLRSLFRAKGFSLPERYALVRALLVLQLKRWRVAENLTVDEWLVQTKQPALLIREFWTPLALAILNTPTSVAAMSRLVPVLRDTLGTGAAALSVLAPHENLTRSIVAPLVQAIEAEGGKVYYRQRITDLTADPAGFNLTQHGTDSQRFEQVVLALPPWALTKLTLPPALDAATLNARFGTQSIATVYLAFAPTFRLSVPLLQIAGPTTADARIWAMDRAHCGEPGVIALSVSAEGPWCALSKVDLAEACLSAFREATHTAEPCLWKKAVTIQQATPAATPKAKIYPHELEPLPNLFLAGDWTHPDYPATLEAAVASGFRAASKILGMRS